MTEQTSASKFNELEKMVQESGGQPVRDAQGNSGLKVADAVNATMANSKNIIEQGLNQADINDGKRDGMLTIGGESKTNAELLALAQQEPSALREASTKILSYAAGSDGIVTREEFATAADELRRDPNGFMNKVAALPTETFASLNAKLDEALRQDTNVASQEPSNNKLQVYPIAEQKPLQALETTHENLPTFEQAKENFNAATVKYNEADKAEKKIDGDIALEAKLHEITQSKMHLDPSKADGVFTTKELDVAAKKIHFDEKTGESAYIKTGDGVYVNPKFEEMLRGFDGGAKLQAANADHYDNLTPSASITGKPAKQAVNER